MVMYVLCGRLPSQATISPAIIIATITGGLHLGMNRSIKKDIVPLSAGDIYCVFLTWSLILAKYIHTYNVFIATPT